MDDTTFIVIAWIALGVVFFLFWIEYKLTDCELGGADTGTDNWLIKFLRRGIYDIRTVRKSKRKIFISEFDDL